MKKISKKDIITYLITFLLTCIVFLPLLTGHYASDSYNIYNLGYHDYAIRYSLNDGRIFMSILGLIADKINISINLFIFITLFCALLISNIAVIKLSKIIKKYKQPTNIFQEIIVMIISYITIFNFMYLENMYFVECIVMAASILLFLTSADILVEKNSKYLIKSLTLASLGVMFYQGTVGMFFTLVCLFTILKNKNNIKQMIIDLLKSGIIAAIAILIDLLTIKICGNILGMYQDRYGSISNIFNNIKFLLFVLPDIMQTACYLFPKNALYIFLGILTIIVAIYQTKNITKEDNTIIYYLAILFVAIASSLVINFTTLSSYDTGRLKDSLGAMIGIVFCLLYVKTNLLDNKTKLSKITILTLLVFSIINIVNYENLMLVHKEVNKLEKKEVQELDEYISQYEEDTGIKVDKIMKVPVRGNSNKAYFKSIKNKSTYARNALRLYWSADGIINFYTQRNLENIRITNEQYEDYLQNEDKQRGYMCIGDTLYINVYIT